MGPNRPGGGEIIVRVFPAKRRRRGKNHIHHLMIVEGSREVKLNRTAPSGDPASSPTA